MILAIVKLFLLVVGLIISVCGFVESYERIKGFDDAFERTELFMEYDKRFNHFNEDESE